MNLSKNQETESTEAPTSFKATKQTKVGEGPTVCVNGLLTTQINDKAQSVSLCALW